ncbi:MAG TPA: hydrogenase 3 maturation endopeptidase HyCI [Acidobacteriota bacterium]|nr:hydrogenase 3 maturation endopeptidase HyCI [Acidobacteriota bacterium]
MSETADIRTELSRLLKGNVLLIGIGNTLRGDDSAGPALIGLLEGKVKAGLLDAGEVPESYFGRILDAQPDTIAVIDAADFGGAPGDLALLEADDIAGRSVSTHQLPLSLFFRLIKRCSRAEVFALGIQPERITFGEPMSPAVASSVNALAELLQDLLGK